MYMEWIAVNEEIPINAKKVLVLNSVGIIDCGWIDLEDGRIICRNSHSFINNVTYWMPLPEPPTK